MLMKDYIVFFYGEQKHTCFRSKIGEAMMTGWK